MSATSAKEQRKTSCRMNATRSAGAIDSSTTRKAILIDSSRVTLSAGPVVAPSPQPLNEPARRTLDEGRPDANRPGVEIDVRTTKRAHLAPSQAGEGGEEHQGAEPSILRAAGPAVHAELPQRTIRRTSRGEGLGMCTHLAVPLVSQTVRAGAELAYVADRTTAHPIREIEDLVDREHRALSGLLVAAPADPARVAPDDVVFFSSRHENGPEQAVRLGRHTDRDRVADEEGDGMARAMVPAG